MTLSPRNLYRRCVFFCALLLCSSLMAQQMPPSGTAGSGQSQSEDQSMGTLRVNVDVVNVYCNVKDKRGALIPDLKRDDFQLTEDGKPQSVKYFATESNQPLTLGLLMDTSGSMIAVIPAEKEVAGAFLDQVITTKDLAFFMTFDIDTQLLQDMTSTPRTIRRAMEEAHVRQPQGGPSITGVGQGPFPTSGNQPGTTLYDAIYLASTEELSQEVGRKALIIMSDGVDEGSKVRLSQAIEAAQKSDAICYVLLFTHGIYGSRGEGEMRRVSEETGGHLFEVSDKYDKLRQAFDQIASELRTQYALGYTPTNNLKDGTFRKIEIKSKAGYRVQARRGYYAIASR